MGFKLSRRTLLRGAIAGAGAAVGLPVLDAMLNGNGDAFANGSPLPKRFGEWFWGNGVIKDVWFPSGTGPTWELTPLMSPLANVKDYLSVVQGMVTYVPYSVSHDGSLMAICSGAAGIPQGGFNYAYSDKTMDQYIADKIGRVTRFRALHFGVASTDTSDADFGVTNKAISHNGPNSPNLPEYDPIAMYDRVFGAGFSSGGSLSDRTLATRKSVLDAVQADTKRLQMKLGASDRARLDAHLSGVQDLEKQLTTMPTPPMCTVPLRPTSSYAAIDAEQIQWDPLNDVQTSLLVYALACDQTRVFTFRFSPCNDFTVYPGFPTFTIDPTTTNDGTSMHGMTHHEPGEQPGVQSCVKFAMTKLAMLLERLKAMPEGAGNLLDNCGIMAFSEVSEGRTHNTVTAPGLPILIAGRAGGRLVYPGIHYISPAQGDQPTETNGRNVSCVPLTMMAAMDTGITQWGRDEGQATKVISELLVAT